MSGIDSSYEIPRSYGIKFPLCVHKPKEEEKRKQVVREWMIEKQ